MVGPRPRVLLTPPLGVWEWCAWGACLGVVCVCVCVEVVFSGKADTVRDSLRVRSESKIILAIKY
jgi:cytochrome c-type biogenesis protein CcmH/NrfF